MSTITAHKKQINCCQWNLNGNWLASGSTDGLIKIYDIRVMKEMESLRGQNSEVNKSNVPFSFAFFDSSYQQICKLSWHPIHESLLVSGGYNGSIAYWIVGQHQVFPSLSLPPCLHLMLLFTGSSFKD